MDDFFFLKNEYSYHKLSFFKKKEFTEKRRFFFSPKNSPEIVTNAYHNERVLKILFFLFSIFSIYCQIWLKYSYQ